MLTVAATVSTWAKIGYAVGAVGLVFAILTWRHQRAERLRLRPVVIAHEARRRYYADGRTLVDVYLTNESATSGFNIRYGIRIGNVEVAWRHDPKDPEPSRLNVLAGGERFPGGDATIRVVIPPEIEYSMAGDPDTGRSYWATFASPSGDRWYTRNPVERSGDLLVRRVRSRKLAISRQRIHHWIQFRRGRARIRGIGDDLLSELRRPGPPDQDDRAS